MHQTSLPFDSTGRFSGLITDYLARAEKSKPFYGRFPELEAFKAQIDEKRASFRHRKALVNALRAQYGESDAPVNIINRLENDRCYTVTTGHQLCLFTGPLYFIYKIVSTIKLAQKLREYYPDDDFIPVFWMASEDHDFDEINHAHFGRNKVLWESGQGGAVGRMKLEGIDEALAEVDSFLGDSALAKNARRLLTDIYHDKNQTLAQATRKLVHAIFGFDELLVIDGDDKTLKGLFAPMVRRELEDQFSAQEVEKTSEKLSQHYNLQVTPRDINLFYLGDQLRERIVADGEGFKVLHTGLRFTREEMLKEVEAHPERFSPNVILRPLYQEVVLPNLAYIGGGGELAYWFQLKSMFKAAKTPFPMLCLRNSVMWMSAADARKLNQLGLSVSGLFAEKESVIQHVVRTESSEDLSLKAEEEKLLDLFDTISKTAESVDPTLKKMVLADGARAAKSLRRIEKRMVRAAKYRHELSVNRVEELFEHLFPGDGLQERHANYFDFYARYGDDFLRTLLEKLDPLDFRFTVLSEGEVSK